MEAWIRGRPASLQDAVAEAARLLGASRMPVVAGLGTDVAGARSAISLARRLRGAIDHMHAAALLRDLDVMRESGMMITTPNEARRRADLLLLVGPGLTEAWPDLPARLLAPHKDQETPRIFWLCPGRARDAAMANMPVSIVGDSPADLPTMLAELRARCAGRPVASQNQTALDTLAAALAQSRFGVAAWSANALDQLTLEMLCGLVKDLNAASRFSGLPLAPSDNAAGVQQVAGWLAGLPLRTGFCRGYAEHDPWRFDAVRLVESGEADCALWISAYRTVSPTWTRTVPLIALTPAPALSR
ncbi:MAG: tungsten formylmethanofuran dehydrogenase, partial [Alphaproteobacteria bacterium]|nr:tungsten formylmethanofuran dehydrogenase [Alphaproteobacteria bacterium]